MSQVHWKNIAANIFWTVMALLGLFGLVALLNYAGALGHIFGS
jgi:hypothetical protein